MKFEVGDMIVCRRDYGIVMKVEEFRVTVTWFEQNDDHPSPRSTVSTQAYRTENLIKAIDGKTNMLVKGNQ
jgi:hypothetical protein